MSSLDIDYEALVEYLRYLEYTGNPCHPECGICYNVDGQFGYGVSSLFEPYYEDWEFFSGCSFYPITSPENLPMVAFHLCSSVTSGGKIDLMWTTGEYARRRRGLCKYLADCIERDYC